MNPMQNGEDYLLSLYEVCEILGKSTRTITRYVHKHILHPRGIKSRQGTLEYRFSRSEIDAFRQREARARQYVYLENNVEPAPMPMQAATFAEYQYPQPQPKTQVPYLIPGISFSVSPGSQVAPPPGVVSGRQAIREEKAQYAEPREKKAKPADVEIGKADEPGRQKDAESALAQKRNDDEIILLLKDTTGMLRDQLKTKDDQIKNLDDKIGQLIERNRETNILLKGLQDKIMLLEKPKEEHSSRKERVDIQPDQKSEPLAGDSSRDDDRNQNTSVRVKILSDLIPVKQPDTGVTVEGAAAPIVENVPRPAPANRDNGDKKGLFGKIFG
jgi:predicted DNA-binding transcriptional regulator AlpA